MYGTVISWLTSSLNAVYKWFCSFFFIEGGVFQRLFISMFVVFMAVRFLIIPLTGSSGMSMFFDSGSSDSVKPVPSSKSEKSGLENQYIKGFNRAKFDFRKKNKK